MWLRTIRAGSGKVGILQTSTLMKVLVSEARRALFPHRQSARHSNRVAASATARLPRIRGRRHLRSCTDTTHSRQDAPAPPTDPYSPCLAALLRHLPSRRRPCPLVRRAAADPCRSGCAVWSRHDIISISSSASVDAASNETALFSSETQLNHAVS